MVAFRFKDGLGDVLWCEQRRCMPGRYAYGEHPGDGLEGGQIFEIW